MKALIIHNGTLSDELKLKIINKIGEDTKVRSSRLDFLKYFFKDFPKHSEKISLIIFHSLSALEIEKAKEYFPKNETFYLIRVGMPSEEYFPVNEDIICINSWTPEKFFNFLHSKKDEL